MTIKICGLRDGANIKAVERLRPDMMGFICWSGSTRYVSTCPSYLPNVCRVGVFVNPSVQEVQNECERLGLNKVQLHGDEQPELCRRIKEATGLPIIKALSVNNHEDIGKALPYTQENAVELLLFDTKCVTRGGSGKHFDWDILQRYEQSTPFLLSGGIGPEDAERILRFRHPSFAGIDLNSRFETQPGIKDTRTLETFLTTIRK